MWVADRLRQAYAEGGPSGLLRQSLSFLYRHSVRPFSPTSRPLLWNGIPVCHPRKWTDSFVPASWNTEWFDDPTYEAGLIEGLNRQVRPGDSVVIVGGGAGVTAVVAAKRTGPEGYVACYEGSAEQCDYVRRTAVLNGVSIDVHHAIVGESIGVYKDPAGFGRVVSADTLPSCNVLSLDCEGAETRILRDMTIRPRVLLVETHGFQGAPTSLVTELMRDCGYEVVDLGVAEPRYADECRQNDVRVLVGTTEAQSALTQ